MLFNLHGVRVPHRKNTASMAPVRIEAETVTVPMSQHIGKPAKPTVKVGDEVFVGTLIGEPDGFVSSPIYSSVSGKVTGIVDFLLPHGVKTVAVTIDSDGKNTPDPSIAPPTVTSAAELAAAIRMGGMVGLGGAAFPSHVKFSIPEGKSVEELIINGAECEPYITSDTRTMLDRSDDIKHALSVILSFIDIKRVIIGIEANKKEAIAEMRRMAEFDSRVSVKVLPSLYPQGGEKVLVYHTTGKVIPAGKLPLDVGCIVCNCTTVAAIGNYLKTGMPLVRKCVTVDGSAVSSPKNISAPIGIALREVFRAAGDFIEEPGKILLGGPMMGVAVKDLDTPVMKGTNAALAFTVKDAMPKKETQCIHCGACANHCPFSLNPAAFMKAYKKNDIEELSRLRVDICMECGCCSYICPAGQPLVETNKLAKADVREAAKRKESEVKADVKA